MGNKARYSRHRFVKNYRRTRWPRPINLIVPDRQIQTLSFYRHEVLMQACKLIPLMYGLFVRLLYSVCYEKQAVSVDYLHQGLCRRDSYAGVPSKVSWRCKIAIMKDWLSCLWFYVMSVVRRTLRDFNHKQQNHVCRHFAFRLCYLSGWRRASDNL